jgi:hypothetical protein
MHNFQDVVRIKDRVIFFLGRRLGEYLLSNWSHPLPLVGYFSMYGVDDYHRVILGSRREGKNVCTQTGREWLPRLMSFASYSPETYGREDRMRYIGLGTGVQEEVAGVSGLITPVAWRVGAQGDEFLAQVDAPPYYGQASSTSIGTTARYLKSFAKDEISLTGTVSLTEAGLFTNLNPLENYAPGSHRSVLLADAPDQPPMFYKAFEPYLKTTRAGVVVGWEIRY